MSHGARVRLLTEIPWDHELHAQAATLTNLILDKARSLAEDLADQAIEGHRLPTLTPKQRTTHIALTQLRLLRLVGFDLLGAVAMARKAGATWEQIGIIFGITRQAAYDRWHRQVSQLLAEHETEPVDPLDDYDPGFTYDVATRTPRPRRGVSRRRRSS
ncbi:hypothetical protein IU483_35265 [Streptomyces gardneri]|nr:hypothetical protein [Streptomyces gardneri]